MKIVENNSIRFVYICRLVLTTCIHQKINLLTIVLLTFTGTYRRKTKRDLVAASSSSTPPAMSSVDVLKAQEMILKEMGPDVCVYEKVCAAYAESKALSKKNHDKNYGRDRMDWEKIIRYEILRIYGRFITSQLLETRLVIFVINCVIIHTSGI